VKRAISSPARKENSDSADFGIHLSEQGVVGESWESFTKTQNHAAAFNRRLRTRKIPKKSHFDQESAAINLQPKTFAECTQVPLKRATLNTDGRGCVARSPDKGTTKRHRNTHQTSF
jgi:formiminotetrahydrofolate cyclodeaminase